MKTLKNKINEDVIRSMFKEDLFYEHCIIDGIVYSKDWKIPLLNIKDMTGRTHIPVELSDYKISSGYCPAHKRILQDLKDVGLDAIQINQAIVEGFIR